MEQHELDELQAYINKHFNNKKIITMKQKQEESQEYFVITKNGSDPVEFVSGIENDEPVFSTDHDEAEWHDELGVVEGYIDRFQIQGVKAVPGEGGNHPPKPRISA